MPGVLMYGSIMTVAGWGEGLFCAPSGTGV